MIKNKQTNKPREHTNYCHYVIKGENTPDPTDFKKITKEYYEELLQASFLTDKTDQFLERHTPSKPTKETANDGLVN